MASVSQQMLMSGAPLPATLTYQGLTTPASSASNVISVPSVPIGAAIGGKTVYLTIGWLTASAVSLTSVTIDGVNAPIADQRTATLGTTSGGCAIVSAPVVTGPSVTVVCTFATGGGSYVITLGSYSSQNILIQAASAVADNAGASVTSLSVSINVQKDGILLAGGFFLASGGYSTAGITKDFEQVIASTYFTVGGSTLIAANQTGRTVTFSEAASFNGPMVAAAFR